MRQLLGGIEIKTIESFYNESSTKNNTRYNIIKSAFRLFSDMGMDSVSMSDVSMESGITTRNLYRYYANKEMLVIDVAYYVFLIADNDYTLVIDPELTGIKALEKLLRELYLNGQQGISGLEFIRFIMYFDLYLTKIPNDNPAYIKYTTVYGNEIRNLGHLNLGQILRKGIEDKSIMMTEDEVTFYSEYIIQSLFSVIMRVLVKEKENPKINSLLIDKQIEVMLAYLKG